MVKFRGFQTVFVATPLFLAIAGCNVDESDKVEEDDNVEVEALDRLTVYAGKDREVLEGRKVELEGIAFSLDGKIESVEWEQTDGPEVDLYFSESGYSAYFRVPSDSAGSTITLEFSAEDDDGNSATSSVILEPDSSSFGPGCTGGVIGDAFGNGTQSMSFCSPEGSRDITIFEGGSISLNLESLDFGSVVPMRSFEWDITTDGASIQEVESHENEIYIELTDDDLDSDGSMTVLITSHFFDGSSKEKTINITVDSDFFQNGSGIGDDF